MTLLLIYPDSDTLPATKVTATQLNALIM